MKRVSKKLEAFLFSFSLSAFCFILLSYDFIRTNSGGHEDSYEGEG